MVEQCEEAISKLFNSTSGNTPPGTVAREWKVQELRLELVCSEVGTSPATNVPIWKGMAA
jgi:hypothetical protein